MPSRSTHRTLDTDGDGTGNNADTDDDGDGVSDGTDLPTDATETIDTDGDGTGNRDPMTMATASRTAETAAGTIRS